MAGKSNFEPEVFVLFRIPIIIMGIFFLIPGIATIILLMPDGNPLGIILTAIGLVLIVLGSICCFWVLNGRSWGKKKTAVGPEVSITEGPRPPPSPPLPDHTDREPAQPRRAAAAPPPRGPLAPPSPYEDHQDYPPPTYPPPSALYPPQGPAYPPANDAAYPPPPR